MAGRRKTRAAAAGGEPAPLAREHRQARRHLAAQSRMAEAGSPSARIGVAADYARSVVVRLPPGQAEQFAEHITTELLNLTRDQFEQRTGNRRPA